MLDIRKYTTLVLWLCCVCTIKSQTIATDWRNFDYVRQSEPWLESENPAGLSWLPVAKISFAEGYVEKNSGKFVNYFQSDNSFTLGAKTESFLRLNERTVFYGKVDYSNFTGKNMSGSAFINPDSKPFDITEINIDDRGEKNLETYNLKGGVSYDCGNIFSNNSVVGLKVDYTAANYAKHKDLRHKNSLLDFNITAGFILKYKKFDVGASFAHRKTVEGLSFDTYGTTDRQYTSLISYGGFFGRTELFDSQGVNDGYTDSSIENPLVATSNELLLQFVFRLPNNWKWFNEIGGGAKKSYYGKRSTLTPVYAESESSFRKYGSVLSHKSRQHRHDLSARIDFDRLKNSENIFRKETTDGNRTQINYFGSAQMLARTTLNANLEYTANLFVGDFNPEWTLSAGVDYNSRRQTATVYPYYRKQNICSIDAYLFAKRAIVKNKNSFDFSLGVLYSTGSGNAKDDGIFANPAEVQNPPASADNYLYSEYEYLTAKQISASAGFRYSRLINANLRGFAGLNFNYAHAFSQEISDARQRQIFCLKIGCFF
jgi:hypothetical protein